MRLHRSLRRSIAASIALTMLTVPLSGCSRTVTTGGLSGRGALGDFLVGGLYGGVMGGFMRPGKPLPEGAFVLELPRVNDERLLVEAVGMDAVRYYAHARICTEKLSRMNKNNSKPQDYLKLLRETAKLWAYAERFADMSQKLAGRLAEKESKPGYDPLAMIDKSPFGRDLFFSVAHAREGWGDPRPPETAEREDAEKARLSWKPVEWSEDIIKTYKQFPAGKGIEGLSKKLGVDAKEAHRQFEMAVSNLNRTYIAGFNFSTQEAGQIYDVGTRAAAATKGTCQVALFVGGVVLAAPLLAPGAASTAMQTAVVANWYAGLTDTIVEGVNDAHIVFTGDSNPGLDEAKKYTGTLSALTSGVMLTTSFSNFALRGEQAIKNTHDTLKAANLNTAGFLDKYGIGGAGVSAILDSSTWTVERGIEASEGKIFGFQVFDWDDGKTVVVPQEVSQDTYRLPTPGAGTPEPNSNDLAWEVEGSFKAPTPISNVPDTELNDLAWEVEGAYTRKDAPAGITEKDEDDKDDPEGGKDSGKDSGEVSDDADFGHKNVIGATGTAEEDQPFYNIIKENGVEKKIPYTIHWVHHFKVVGNNKGYGFEILDEPEVTAVGYGAKSKAKSATFQVVSYDSGTGAGKVKVKNKTFPFSFSGKPGSMTITIEGFKYAEPKK